MSKNQLYLLIGYKNYSFQLYANAFHLIHMTWMFISSLEVIRKDSYYYFRAIFLQVHNVYCSAKSTVG